MTRSMDDLAKMAGVKEGKSALGRADMKRKDRGKDVKPGKVKKFSRKELEAYAKEMGLKLVKEDGSPLKEAKIDMDRVKKGVAHSMQKNDMKAVSKVAKEVLRDGGQKDFDDIMDFIVQMAR